MLSKDKQVTFEEDNTDVKYDDKGEIKVNSQTVMEGGDKDKKAGGDKEEKEATVTYNQLIVPKGKHSTLLLSDGTKLWVNAGSHVIFPVSFKGNKREIYVDGEVFLDVTRNEDNPFVVKTDRMAVEVLGTSFNIKSYGHEDTDDVVLVTGSVHVRTETGRKAELIPNQRFRCTSIGDVDIQTVDVYDYISWKDGLLQYKKERLSVILQRLSDYYGKPIRWEPELERLTCSGKLDLKDDMEKVLNGLTRMIPVKFVKQDDCYYFSVTPLNSKPME
ncbi:FecR domain-containing protein [Parabacteroides faecis]|uniref:FecR family protein n=1 Tax=Parabacteroides faecis TaxID=1217282 RepID=UPI0021646C62|nr:FecR domain-containing protein [Parabacteroides faecis]UVQ45316.1 FecR domain-containing protein [Parabacteroides faecis]